MMKASALALLCALGLPVSAHAEPGGTADVYGPSVSRGEGELEYRAASFDGGALDGAVSHRGEIGYGLTDWWRPALVVQAADAAGGSELTTIAIESVFDFTATRSWPVHFGGYVEYAFGQNGRDDALEFKLLAERRQGPLTLRLNLIAERPIGAGAADEWEHAYAARAMWRASDRWALGLEGFGEAQAHYWGPRASLNIGDASIALAYLLGIDEAQSDAQLRLAIELEG